ncbi:MAG: N-acetyl sugar amidotransferase [Pseudomonadales bacterium]|nr:N-acetyl sugar amidotransferase [Pseudomonadales bacterium]
MNRTVCTRCVMDTSDEKITFNSVGECSHCQIFDKDSQSMWFPNETGKQKLGKILEQIRKEGEGKEYDCIIGLSGGVDSSYLALKMKDWGLRPLVVHIDVGWNSELAVHNIEQIVKYCGFDLYTDVVDWEEVRDLQVAYLKSGVSNQDVVQDHAIFSSLYHFAVRNGIRYVISGGNMATESVAPHSWHHSAMDSINLRAIHKRFGHKKLQSFKTISFFQYFFYYPFIKKMTTIRPLNYMPYNKKEALEELVRTVGYKEYGRKHGESRFTKFFQNYYLPKKFDYDKRKVHLSSLILSGEITRDCALKELEKPLYDPVELKNDKEYVAKKLKLSVVELDQLIDEPGRSYVEFDNWDRHYALLQKLKNILQKVTNKKIKTYA